MVDIYTLVGIMGTYLMMNGEPSKASLALCGCRCLWAFVNSRGASLPALVIAWEHDYSDHNNKSSIKRVYELRFASHVQVNNSMVPD